MYKAIVLNPRMSEKSYGLSQTARTYVFDVPADLSKHDVARAVTAQFNTVVTNVNITNIPGKAKRTITKRRQHKGRNAAIRKAYITLAEGQSIPIFAAVEESEAKEEATQAKLEKVMAKQADKEEKKTEKETKPARRGVLRRAKKEDSK